MRIKKAIYSTVIGLMLLPAAVVAQNSSINTYSPYTFYGVGDISNLGTASQCSMGGIGIALRDGSTVNYLNPASYSMVFRKSFLFNFGMEGENYYLKTADRKTSYNTFNVRDISIKFPIANRLGFGFSVTPFSSVGYRLEQHDDRPEILANIGDIRYKWTGEGDLTQFKAGIGWEPWRNVLSIGAEMIYIHGNLERSFDMELIPIISEGRVYNTVAEQTEKYSRIFWNFGLQANIISDAKRMLTLGATYQPGGKLNPNIRRYIVRQDIEGGESDLSGRSSSEFGLPTIVGVGVFYQTTKIGVGFDYSYNAWVKHNKNYLDRSENTSVKMQNTNTFKVGVEFTPNRADFRRYGRRITYRAGARYSDYYLRFADHSIDEKAITAGAGFPINFLGRNYIDFGIEFGQRGNTSHGLIKHNFFKFSIGLSLFGEDYWFQKHLYD